MSFNRRAPPPRSIPAGFRFVAKKADRAAHAEIVMPHAENAAWLAQARAIPFSALSAFSSICRMLSPDRPNRTPRSFRGVA
jgi:hypothetical protein